MKTENFNLLDESWIPVLYHDGRWERIGVRQTVKDASRIRQFASGNPLDNFAVFRLLLVLLYRCEGVPENSAEKLPSTWADKLDSQTRYFNQFGTGPRFFQDVSCSQKRPGHTINYLIHEVPSGTNKWHFRHSTDQIDGLCPACCALGLARLPVFTTSGGAGKAPGLNGVPPNYITPSGPNLESALCQSWRKPSVNLGIPTWESTNSDLPNEGEVDLLFGMTWHPRRVWLGSSEAHKAQCILCGQRDFLISTCVFDGKGSQKSDARNWSDPHVLSTRSPKGEAYSSRPRDALSSPDASTGHWTRICSDIFQSELTSDQKGFVVVSFSTVQNDKYLEATEYRFDTSMARIPDETLVSILEKWNSEGKRILNGPKSRKQSDRRLAKGLDFWGESRAALVTPIRPSIEHAVNSCRNDLLTGTDEAWQKAAERYRPMLKMLANSLSPGFTTAAVRRRIEVAQSTPFPLKSLEPNPRKRKPGK